MKRREAWKDYVERGQTNRAIEWLMCVRSMSGAGASAHIRNYVKNEVGKKK